MWKDFGKLIKLLYQACYNLLAQLIATLMHYPCTVSLTSLANWSALSRAHCANHVKVITEQIRSYISMGILLMWLQRFYLMYHDMYLYSLDYNNYDCAIILILVKAYIIQLLHKTCYIATWKFSRDPIFKCYLWFFVISQSWGIVSISNWLSQYSNHLDI